jgi:hypothetical protein
VERNPKPLWVRMSSWTYAGCRPSSANFALVSVKAGIEQAGALTMPAALTSRGFSMKMRASPTRRCYRGRAAGRRGYRRASCRAWPFRSRTRPLSDGYVRDRFYFVGSDYIYPRQSHRLMCELLRASRLGRRRALWAGGAPSWVKAPASCDLSLEGDLGRSRSGGSNDLKPFRARRSRRVAISSTRSWP